MRLAITRSTLANLQSIAKRVRQTVKMQRVQFLETASSASSDDHMFLSENARAEMPADADVESENVAPGVGPLRYGSIQIVGDDLMAVCFASGVLSPDFALFRVQDYRANFRQEPKCSNSHVFTHQSLTFRVGDHAVDEVAELSVYHVQRAPGVRLHAEEDPHKFFKLCLDSRNSRLGIITGPRCKIDMGTHLRAETLVLESRFGLKTRGSVGVTLDAGQYVWLHGLIRAYVERATSKEAINLTAESGNREDAPPPVTSEPQALDTLRRSPLLLNANANATQAAESVHEWVYVCLLREEVEDDPDGIYTRRSKRSHKRNAVEAGESADNDGYVRILRVEKGGGG